MPDDAIAVRSSGRSADGDRLTADSTSAIFHLNIAIAATGGDVPW